MKHIIFSLAILGVALVINPVFAQKKKPNSDNEELRTDIKNPPVKRDGRHLVNVDENGLILLGYDVVTFHTEEEPVKGNPKFKATYQGAIYQFASAVNKKIFEENPEKYIPQFGGFCSIAVALGKLSPIQLWTYSIVDDRLLFQHNEKAVKLWEKNVEGNLKKADKKWPKVSQKTSY